MSLLSPENKQDRLNELYEYGKSKGALTYKEIMDRLMELEMDPDQLISMANQCLARIRKSALQKKYDTLMSQIGSLPPDDSSVPALLKEAQDVQAKLRLI